MDDQIEKTPLAAITQDHTWWPRQGYEEEALARYRECLDQLPPVHVDRKTGILLDGFHRVRVFEEAGRTEVPVVFEDCEPGTYQLRSLQLNQHGAPIPIAQRNLVLVKLADQGWPQRDIAQAAGLTQERVSQILAAYRRDRLDARPEPGDQLYEAIRLVEQGRSIRDAARVTGVSKSTIERAVVGAKGRQEMIRRHLQARGSLTSLLRYPERGPWGKASYPGNCSGYLLVDLIDYLKPHSVFDPMEGSGTTKDVCIDLAVEYEGRDLRGGFDLLSSPLPDRTFGLVFWHPPYWPGHRYSQHLNDFSNASRVADYLDRVRSGFLRLTDLITPGGHLALLIGDGRKEGSFYPVHATILGWDLLPVEAVLIKLGDHERRAQHFAYGPRPFIPTLHEYVLIFKGGKA